LTLPLLTDTEITCTGVDYKNLGAGSQKGSPKYRHCEREMLDYVDNRVKYVSHFNL